MRNNRGNYHPHPQHPYGCESVILRPQVSDGVITGEWTTRNSRAYPQINLIRQNMNRYLSKTIRFRYWKQVYSGSLYYRYNHSLNTIGQQVFEERFDGLARSQDKCFQNRRQTERLSLFVANDWQSFN